jgi:hypothetical protein
MHIDDQEIDENFPWGRSFSPLGWQNTVDYFSFNKTYTKYRSIKKESQFSKNVTFFVTHSKNHYQQTYHTAEKITGRFYKKEQRETLHKLHRNIGDTQIAAHQLGDMKKLN